jgi:hypothetical protein
MLDLLGAPIGAEAALGVVVMTRGGDRQAVGEGRRRGNLAAGRSFMEPPALPEAAWENKQGLGPEYHAEGA